MTHLLAQGNWELLSLPAIATKDESFPRLFGGRIIRKKGEALNPAREDRAQLREAILHMGAKAFMAQYQQDPYPPGQGGLRGGAFHFAPHPDATEEECKHASFFLGTVPEETFLLERYFGEFSGIRPGPPPRMTSEEWMESCQRYSSGSSGETENPYGAGPK